MNIKMPKKNIYICVWQGESTSSGASEVGIFPELEVWHEYFRDGASVNIQVNEIEIWENAETLEIWCCLGRNLRLYAKVVRTLSTNVRCSSEYSAVQVVSKCETASQMRKRHLLRLDLV